MAFSRWLLGAGVALVAVAAAAQEQPDAGAEPPAKAEAAPSQRLEGLEETVDALLREENATASEPDEAAQTTEAGAPPAEAAPATEPAADESDATAEPEPAPEATPPAPSTSAPPPPLTRAQIATLDRTVARGRLLIEIARAGIVATQDMLTRMSDPNGAGIAGWIAEPAGNAVEVTFYAEADGETGAPSAVYRATVLGGRVTSREIFLGADRPPLNAIEARMARARTASDDDALRACTDQPFNVLVVPPASGDAPIDVYRISAPVARGQIPLGGHFRSTLAVDGSIESHAFANACPMIQVAPPAEGTMPPPVGVTHLADPLPTEIHMLLAQTAGRPLLVVAGDPQRLWLVTGEGIAEVRDRQGR